MGVLYYKLGRGKGRERKTLLHGMFLFQCDISLEDLMKKVFGFILTLYQDFIPLFKRTQPIYWPYRRIVWVFVLVFTSINIPL